MLKKMLQLLLILTVVVSFPLGASAQNESIFNNYEFCITKDGAFSLYKPKGWRVGTEHFQNGRRVFAVNPENTAFANITFLKNVDRNLNAVSLASGTLKNLSSQLPGVRVREARSDQNRSHAMVTYQRSGSNGMVFQGRFHFNVKLPLAVTCGYEAPVAQFGKMAGTLLTIIANINILDQQAFKKGYAQIKNRRPATLNMTKIAAQDKTCRLNVPQGWNIQAGGGAALTTDASGDVGFIFAPIKFVGRSRIPYFNSNNIPGDLRYEYMRPIEALIVFGQHSGSSHHRVLERYNNQAAAREAVPYLGRGAASEIAIISYRSKNGVALVGYFDVVSWPPDNSGQWGINVTGFWAPQKQFSQYLGTLLAVAESFRINKAYAEAYVRQGKQRIREMMRKTSSLMSRYAQEMRASNLAGHTNRMRSMDYRSYKFSTYMRGEQEWVTKLEGGVLYSTNHYGLSIGDQRIEGGKFNYYNFQGDTQYGHIPVDISREVYEAVYGTQ